MSPDKTAPDFHEVAPQAAAKHIFPTTFAQQRLWFLERLLPGNTSYLIPWFLRISGRLNVAALEKSLNEIVARHEVLRTTLGWKDGAPVQVVTGTLSVPLPVTDLSRLSQPEEEARRLMREESRKPLDLERGPLVRAQLLRLGEQEHVLFLTMHHIIFDGWSRRIFAAELAALYDAFCNQQPSPLPAPRLQYADYAVWQRKYLQGATLEKQLSYWREQLADAPARIDLPFDRPRPPIQTSNGAKHPVEFSPQLTQDLRDFSRRQGVTLFMTLLAGFQVLVARYSNQEDIVVGSPIANRNRSEIEEVIGFFANTLALRTRIPGDATFETVLEQVKETALGAYAHQDLPFEKLVEELQPDRNLSHNPLFQVLFSLQNAPRQAFELSGLKLSFMNAEEVSSKFDLSVFLTEHDDLIRGRAEYNTDLFDASTIERLILHYRTLLRSAISNPQQLVSHLPILPPEEVQAIVGFNPGRRALPVGRCLPALVEESARRSPESTALICGKQRIRYRQLNERANQLAHYLIQRGAGPEVLVGVYLERTADLVTVILGVLKSGAAYVPLDPSYPPDRIHAILADSGAKMVVTQEWLARDLAGSAAQAICVDSEEQSISRQPCDNPEPRSKPDNLAYVLFTSGSTGRPKGVAIEHRSAVTLVDWALTVFTREELSGVLFSTSVCFDLSIFEMFVPLSAGGAVVLVQNALYLPTAEARNQVTLINTVPSAITELLRMRAVPRSVRTINLAGEPLKTSLANQIYSSTSVRKVYNLYGPTEDTTYSTYKHVHRGEDVTIGRPIANTQVYILDRNRQLVPIGVPGELYLAGEGLARGYYGQPELTAERFVVANSPGSGLPARMYKTGDLARILVNGEIQYLGRLDYQVKLRGYRIELGEIESVLSLHSSVQQAVAVVRDAPSGDKQLLAYVAVRDGSDAERTSEVLRSHLKQHLPEYMIPLMIVVLEALPLTSTGKIDRKALPTPAPLAGRSEITAPRDEIEAALSKIWRKVLHNEAIGVTDNFFDVGGHSLLAVQLMAAIATETGHEVPLTALFRAPTVESMAKLLRDGNQSQADPIVMPVQAGDGVPFFAVAAPGTTALGYAALAKAMGATQVVYKLQSRRVVPPTSPITLTDMRSLALEYIEGMRSVQPSGPYYLGGMCAGAHIAEQMILELEAQGETVGLFAVFDTWVLQNSYVRWLWRIHYYHQRTRQLLRSGGRRRLKSLTRSLHRTLDRITHPFSRPPNTPWQKVYWPGKDFSNPHFNAPVALFKRPRQPFYYVKDTTMGWGSRSRGGVEIHCIDVPHLMLRQPYVGELGSLLRESLSRATSNSPHRDRIWRMLDGSVAHPKAIDVQT
jgi:amino acid adenylation domain-containing protein